MWLLHTILKILPVVLIYTHIHAAITQLYVLHAPHVVINTAAAGFLKYWTVYTSSTKP